MKYEPSKRIELAEYASLEFPGSYELEELLWNNYREQVELHPPSSKTNRKWILEARGWIGRIPLTSDMEIVLQPKIPIENVFGMLEYAYNLSQEKFLFPPGLTNTELLGHFYERLASVLSQKILDRGRKGFYREYNIKKGESPYIRGRLNIRRVYFKPWDVKYECFYEEHTPDVIENQILIWTLRYILHSGLCTPRHSLPIVHRAYRSLQGFATPIPYEARDCLSIFYNRLNQDYQPLHALCRFFLENSGPSHRVGDRTMLPFLIHMPSLYELFVSQWIKAHKNLFPSELSFHPLEKLTMGQGRKIRFEIDLVIYRDGKPYCVLDTKYKIPNDIKNPDINQVVAYASAKDCHKAFLVYPKYPYLPLDTVFRGGNIHVRSLTFSLEGDLEQAGQDFVNDLCMCLDHNNQHR